MPSEERKLTKKEREFLATPPPEKKEVKGLVSKPQFDDKVFKIGKPVKLSKHPGAYNYNFTGLGKFTNGDYGLIIGVSPLSIFILLSDKKEANIPVEAVADGSVEIEIVG